jgi:hypothetical protein
MTIATIGLTAQFCFYRIEKLDSVVWLLYFVTSADRSAPHKRKIAKASLERKLGDRSINFELI